MDYDMNDQIVTSSYIFWSVSRSWTLFVAIKRFGAM